MIARHLELKIPPLLLTLIFGLLIWLTSLWLPATVIPGTTRLIITAIFAGLGAFAGITGVVSFRKAKTTVNPTTPDASSSLVTTGIYARTRNPMYLGLLLILVAWTVFLSCLYGLALCVMYVMYLNRLQIQPEEEALLSTYGTEFTTYRTRVRRWL